MDHRRNHGHKDEFYVKNTTKFSYANRDHTHLYKYNQKIKINKCTITSSSTRLLYDRGIYINMVDFTKLTTCMLKMDVNAITKYFSSFLHSTKMGQRLRHYVCTCSIKRRFTYLSIPLTHKTVTPHLDRHGIMTREEDETGFKKIDLSPTTTTSTTTTTTTTLYYCYEIGFNYDPSKRFMGCPVINLEVKYAKRDPYVVKYQTFREVGGYRSLAAEAYVLNIHLLGLADNINLPTTYNPDEVQNYFAGTTTREKYLRTQINYLIS
jgi:hypothetical protein